MSKLKIELKELSYEEVSEIYRRGRFTYVDSSRTNDAAIIAVYSKELEEKGYTFRGIGSYGDTICQMYQRENDIIFLEFETEEGWLSYLNVLHLEETNYYKSGNVVGVIC